MKARLIDFDLEKAKAGAKVVTSEGHDVRILCYDRVATFPIVALFKVFDNEYVCFCSESGAIHDNSDGNISRLMIEEPIYEDGDIIAFGCEEDNPIIGIFKALSAYGRYTHCDYFDLLHNGTMKFSPAEEFINDNLRLATEEEKNKLFDALAKEGKRWNAEKKCIEELPRNTHEFKPFDKVLVRDKDDEEWRTEIFSNYYKTVNGDPFYRCLVAAWEQCIPYEGNESLLGTSNKPSNNINL